MKLLSGQRAFVLQRLTALLMLAYAAATALRLAFGARPDLATWQQWTARPSGATVLVVLAAALCLHAWVGVRDVVLDYVRPFALRLAVLAAVAAALASIAAWTFLIVVTHALSHLSV